MNDDRPPFKMIHLTHDQWQEVVGGQTVIVAGFAIKRINAQMTAVAAGTHTIIELLEHEVEELSLVRELYSKDPDNRFAIKVDPSKAPVRFFDISTVYAPFLPVEFT